MIQSNNIKNMFEYKNLTEDIILKKYKVNDIGLIKKLNLWGLKVTNVNILKEMPQLEIISLSANLISKLEPIKYCTNLVELYLRKNKIEDIKEFEHLRPLKHLKTLWIADNPCCSEPIPCRNPELLNYTDSDSLFRLYIINLLPQIQILDNVEITHPERNKAVELFEEPLLNSVDESLLVIPSESDNSVSQDSTMPETVSQTPFEGYTRTLASQGFTMPQSTTQLVTKSILGTYASQESSISGNKNRVIFKDSSYKEFYNHDKYARYKEADTESPDCVSDIRTELAPTGDMSAVTGAIDQLLSVLNRRELMKVQTCIDKRLASLDMKAELDVDN